MKLNATECLKIEQYLESKGVFCIELKYEILDHMASEIEYHITHNDFDFKDAFALERQNWHSELNCFEISRFNFKINMPKIVLRNNWNIIKRMYFISILFSFYAFLFLNLVLRIEVISPIQLNTILGNTYLFILFTIVIGLIHMMFSKKHTISRMVYNSTITYYIFWILLINPFLSSLYCIYQGGKLSLIFLAIHSFLLCFSLNLPQLFLDHRKQLKMFSK